MSIPINHTFLNPYICAAFLFIEQGLESFVKEISNYQVQIKKHNEPGEYKIIINFAYENEAVEDKIYFYLKKTDTLEALNLKLEMAAEEIIKTLKRINDTY